MRMHLFPLLIHYIPRLRIIACVLFTAAGLSTGQGGVISGPAYQVLNSRSGADRTLFYVYQDQDSGFNHGFPSGKFGDIDTITIDSGCIDDPNDPNQVHGCAPQNDSAILDTTHGTIMRVTFGPQSMQSGRHGYAGINIEEPENWGVNKSGKGYDVRGAVNLVFDVRSPDGAMLQFGVGGCSTGYMALPTTWTTLTLPLSSLCSGGLDLSGVHILFAVAANDQYTRNGGTALLDNIRFEPVPNTQRAALSFPLGNQTFGVVPLQNKAPGPIPFPSDQVLRNLTTIYESSMAELALLARGTTQDLVNARLIADTFDYALHHDTHGDSLPPAPDGSTGLHNGYESGDVSLFNDQVSPKLGKSGDARLAGFTVNGSLCAPSDYCLVLDDATGGNNAFAIMALLGAYGQFNDVRFLNDAREIGTWILDNLADNSGQGYGGYYAGYFGLNVGMQGILNRGKSTENNADIYAAFTSLAAAETRLHNLGEAAKWTGAAKGAGDFVMLMYDAPDGRFNLGTVPTNSPPPVGPAFCPGPQNGSDILNTCDFLDSNTFPILAMAAAPNYQNRIDWRRPATYVLQNFAQQITAGSLTFQGFDIVPVPTSGPNGIAWEFTAQEVAAMRYLDLLYRQTLFDADADLYQAQLRLAQTSAPFGDGQGLAAATLQDGDRLSPLDQCLDTPFQCIAERVGLAATAWATLAEQNYNPFFLAPFTPLGSAIYDADLRVPRCWVAFRSCDSGSSLLLGKDHMAGGFEPNQPNTIHSSCADGRAGTFHLDESIDRLSIATTNGGILSQGSIVQVSTKVWIADPARDALDLYYAVDANNPAWSYLTTLVPQARGSQTLKALYALRTGHLQAIRASLRRDGTRSSCSTGNYDDHDDLVFAVQ